MNVAGSVETLRKFVIDVAIYKKKDIYFISDMLIHTNAHEKGVRDLP